MNKHRILKYYKKTYQQKRFEKKLQAKVDQEDLVRWSEGFNSVVEPVDEDTKNEIQRQEEIDQYEKEDYQRNLVQSMALEIK
jgi:hypothetical protein